MAMLRSMAAADLEAILTIQNASPDAAQWPAADWGVFCAREDAAEHGGLRVGNCAWVAEGERGAAGFLAGLFAGDEFEILNLAVAPSERRKRIASQLLLAALQSARKAGGRRAILEVRAFNTGAIAFYEGQGFVRAGIRKNYYRAPVEDALILARDL